MKNYFFDRERSVGRGQKKYYEISWVMTRKMLELLHDVLTSRRKYTT